jgi:hypothetical protein
MTKNENKNTNKKEPLRIVVFIIAAAYIIYMWVEKDIVAIYSSMPPEQALPMAVTTIVVSFLKVAILAGGILLVKWIVGKLKK